MKRAVALPVSALLVSALLPACVDVVDGNGVVAEEERPQRDFDRVDARGELEVVISEGAFAVTVRIDENLLPYVQTTVSGGALVIAVRDVDIREYLPGPHVIVSMPELSDVELTGSGSLTAEGFDVERPVSVELSGSGSLAWSGAADTLDAILAGSGTLDLGGTADSARLTLLGSGTLDARGLTARGANVQLEGSGSVVATVNGRVDARATGSGSIDLYGEVIEGLWAVTGGATIDVH